jgi:hypothetical protein
MIGTASSERRASDRVAQQPPPLVEAEQLQPLALRAHQVHREHRDQAHDLLANPLGLRVLRARHAGRWRGQVANRQVGDLPVPDGRQLHRGVREPELGQTGASVDVERPAHLDVGLIPLFERSHNLAARGLGAAGEHAVDRTDDSRLPRWLRSPRQQVAQE